MQEIDVEAISQPPVAPGFDHTEAKSRCPWTKRDGAEEKDFKENEERNMASLSLVNRYFIDNIRWSLTDSFA